jgi:hypothetical protein
MATDNCAGAITGTHDATLPITVQGTTVVTWTYDDGNGNTSTQTQHVVIQDITDPIITCVVDQTIELNEDETNYFVVGNEFDASATDNCEIAILSNDLNDIASLEGESLPIGTHIITWNVEDVAGNIAVCSTTIIVNGYNGITNDENVIKIYPNPAREKIILQNISGYKIAIVDLTGKQITSKKYESNSAELDVSEFSQGLYLVYFESENNRFVKSIIIE